MVVYDIHVIGIALFPAKADAPTIIDPDAVLPLPISFQSLQAVRRRDTQVLQRLGSIEHSQLPQRNTMDVRPESTHRLAIEKSLSLSRSKRSDHGFIL
jgi:hypothetical protein